MVCRSPSRIKNERFSGFTIIEIVGVLAIIAILAAMITPRIFDAISDSRITSLVSATKSIQASVTKYYTDVGSLYPANNAGAGVADAAGAMLPNILTGLTAAPNPAVGLWLKIRQPYLDRFPTNQPPVGTAMIMPSVASAGFGAAVNAGVATNYDLNNDGNNDFVNAGEVVSLQINGITQKEFEKLDAILDDGIGTTLAEKSARGKVKWQNAAGGTARIYLANR